MNITARLLPVLAALLPVVPLLASLTPPARAQATYVVDTTDDDPDAVVGDGACATAAGACSFRAAMQETEATPAADEIHFDIPGVGPHTIAVVGSNLPTLFQPLVIDGYTQPGASPNTNGPTQGTNAVIRIELVNGDDRTHGLRLCFGAKTIRGLAVGGFTSNGIGLECEAGGHVVEGCFVGTDASGTVARPNEDTGVQITTSSGNRIGGTVPAARNVISGNGRIGVAIASSGSQQGAANNLVQGNLIGTDASGTVPLPNGTLNSQLNGGAGITGGLGSLAGNVFGGLTAAKRNVISGNAGPGVRVVVGTDIRVEGNFIGTDVTGTLPLPNTGEGVLVTTSNITVGGTAPGAGNRIAHNGGAGVFVEGFGTRNRVLGNAISGNDGIGIELRISVISGQGPTPNDPGDPDEGPNRFQNFPELQAIALDGSGDLVVTYAVDTDPASATYPLRVEFFRADGDGEGEAFLGADTYGESDFSGCGSPPCAKTATFTPAATVGLGDAFVATATDAEGNTSEFPSAPVVSNEPGPVEAQAALHAPSPNPTTAAVRLVFTLHRPGRVRLAVYDVLGREVAVSIDKELPVGQHEAVLEGWGLAAGTYLVRMTTEREPAQTRMITLLR